MEQKPPLKSQQKGKNNNLHLAFILLFIAVASAITMPETIRTRVIYSTLPETGMKTKGTVISKHSLRSGRTWHYTIKYEYTAPDGTQFTDKANARESDYLHYSEGMKFDLYISPTNPKLNKPEFAPTPPLIIVIPFTLFGILSTIGSVLLFLKHFKSTKAIKPKQT